MGGSFSYRCCSSVYVSKVLCSLLQSLWESLPFRNFHVAQACQAAGKIRDKFSASVWWVWDTAGPPCRLQFDKRTRQLLPSEVLFGLRHVSLQVPLRPLRLPATHSPWQFSGQSNQRFAAISGSEGVRRRSGAFGSRQGSCEAFTRRLPGVLGALRRSQGALTRPAFKASNLNDFRTVGRLPAERACQEPLALDGHPWVHTAPRSVPRELCAEA